MGLEEKAGNLTKRTISRDLIAKFAVITDSTQDEVIEMVRYWRDRNDFDGVKEYITFRVENSLTERIKRDILAQKEINNVKTQ